MLNDYGSLIKFSGQGVEKTNDLIKQIHQSKSNKINPTHDALLVRKRLEIGFVENGDRPKRKYVKADSPFWTNGKSSIIAKKKQKIISEQKAANENYQSETVAACD